MPDFQQPPTNYDYLEEYEFANYEVLGQLRKPICFVPVACTLDITGYTVTNVTTRGGNDGTITLGVSGNTGATITWYQGATELTYETSTIITVTGLTAGFYQISAEEGECEDYVRDIQVLDGEFRTGDMVITQPADLTAAENPILYELRTALTGSGSKAQVQLIIGSGTTSDGDYFKLNLTSPYEYTQTFYAKGFPNKSNYFLASLITDDNGIGVGTNTAAEVAQSLADALQQDVLIPKVYTVSYDGNRTITLTAKQVGERFTLNESNVDTSGSNLSILSIQDGINAYDGQQVDDYSIYVEIFENDNRLIYPTIGQYQNYQRIAELELPFQSNNIHRFDVAPILKNFVYSVRPEFDATGYTIQPDFLKPYFIKYGEKYPVVKNTNTKKKRYKGRTLTKWVCNSALGHYTANDMEALGYLGDRFHDIKADFNGVVTTTGASKVQILIDDYLWDTGNTTGIQFRFTQNITPDSDTGWQTSNFAEFTSVTYGEGEVYISGVTDGVTVTYKKYWWCYTDYNVGAIEGYNREPDIVNDVAFLTNAPNPKLIQRNSQEYLYFILQGEYDAALDLRGDIYYYDGTSTTGVTFFTIQSATGNTAGGVLALNLSYDKLGLANYESSGGTNRKIKRLGYAVYQTDASGNTFQYTEQRQYRMEIEDRPRKFGLIFQNKVGGYDSFDFVGIVEDTIDRSKGTYTLPITFNQDGSAAQGFKSTATFNTRVTNKIIVNSGWIDEDHFDWLKELMESNDIYSYTTDNQNYLNLDSFKYKKSSLDDLYEVECTFTQTIYENNIEI